MHLSGFASTPVSRLLFCSVVIVSLVSSLTDTKHYAPILVDPHLTAWGQWWRLLTWQLGYNNSVEVLCASIGFYELRVVERIWGSSKFASFLALTFLISSLVTPLLVIFVLRPLSFGRINYIPSGPTSLLFALLAQYYATIPSTYQYKLGLTSPGDSPNTSSSTSSIPSLSSVGTSTVIFSSKTLHYLLPLQLAFTQFPHALLPATVGWTIGHAYRSELLPGSRWRVPAWILGKTKKNMGVEALRRRMEFEAPEGGPSTVEGGTPTLGGLLGEQFMGRRRA